MDAREEAPEQASSRRLRGLATFSSTHHVLKAEKLLIDQGLAVKMVPMPRQISSDCGVALEFDYELAPSVQAAVRAAGIEMRQIHQLPAK